MVAEFVGVTVRPTAFVVLVSRLIPACEVFPPLLVWKGIVQVDPRVQVCELTVVAALVVAYPGIVRPEGRVVDSEGTPPALVTRTALLTGEM